MRSLYGLCDNFGTGPSDALIALTMIVGTYVEILMCFMVIPFYKLRVENGELRVKG